MLGISNKNCHPERIVLRSRRTPIPGTYSRSSIIEPALQDNPADPLDPTTRKQLAFAVQVGKLVIVLLVLGLLSGLSRASEVPTWAMLLVVAINLTMTASMIWAVLRLERSLK